MYTDKEIDSLIKKEERELLKSLGLYKEFRRLRKRFKREIFADVHIYSDEEEGNPDNKFFTAEVVRDWQDNLELVYMCGARELDELLRELEDYLDEYQ